MRYVHTLTASVAMLFATGAFGQQPILTNVGINLPGLSYVANMALYSDLANAWSGGNGPWDYQDGTRAAMLDSTGAPTEPDSYTFYPANYDDITLTWTGSGTFTVDGSCNVVSQAPNSIHFTCPVVNSAQAGTDPTSGAQNLISYMLRATPPVSNIHAMLPASERCGMFTCKLLQDIQPFTNIRYMDLLYTNNDISGSTVNLTSNWSDRTWPNEGSRGLKPQGIAYEDIIALSNQAGKNAWINIPIMATDDYVCRLARLLAYGEQGDKTNAPCNPTAAGNGTVPPINQSIVLRLEWGNELWNQGFPFWEALYCWVNGGPEPGQSCPMGTPAQAPSAYLRSEVATPKWNWFATNQDPSGKTLTAYMLGVHHFKDIFTQVFNAAHRTNQIKSLINTQSFLGSINVYYIQNFWTPNYGGAPADIMAFAPYAGPQCTDMGFPPPCPASGDSDVNLLFQDIASSFNDPMYGNFQELQDDVNQARSVNMAPEVYERGIDWVSGDYTAVEVQGSYDPRIGQYETMWDQQFASTFGPNALNNYFSMYGAWTQFGNWGIIPNQADACHTSPRAVALYAAIGGVCQ